MEYKVRSSDCVLCTTAIYVLYVRVMKLTVRLEPSVQRLVQQYWPHKKVIAQTFSRPYKVK